MRSITYDFDELPIRALDGSVVARVAGKADLYIHDDAVDMIDIYVFSEDGVCAPLTKLDPLFPAMRREIVARWERCDFDGDRYAGRPETAEHRLSLAQVL